MGSVLLISIMNDLYHDGALVLKTEFLEERTQPKIDVEIKS